MLLRQITGLAALAVISAACTTTPPSATGGGEQPAASHASDCVTWQTYRTRDTTLPDLPAGFEQGCLFTVAGPRPSDPPPLYILRNDIDLSAIAATDPDLTSEGDPPQLPLRSDLTPNFLQSDAVTTYSRACTLIDPSRRRNCDNPPTYQAYLVTAEGTVCFQQHCLQAPATPTERLIALWGSPLPGPIASLDTAHQYTPVPVEAAVANIDAPETAPFSETIVGQRIVAYSPWAIALRAYGRKILGEGQYPTVITEVDGEDGAAVVVTNFGALDDAIGGQRYRLDFEFRDGNKFELAAVGAQQYCRRSTPPQWTTALCP